MVRREPVKLSFSEKRNIYAGMSVDVKGPGLFLSPVPSVMSFVGRSRPVSEPRSNVI